MGFFGASNDPKRWDWEVTSMYPKEFFAHGAPQQRNGTCFVIMPFADTFTEVYETLREAVESPEVSFDCIRADDLVGGGHIIRDILRGVPEAEVVIADLTGRNPNVFYELGNRPHG